VDLEFGIFCSFVSVNCSYTNLSNAQIAVFEMLYSSYSPLWEGSLKEWTSGMYECCHLSLCDKFDNE